MLPQHAMEILDAARLYNRGNPPETIRSADGSIEIPNIWKQRPPQTILGSEQKAWFLERLRTSSATWKIWGNTTATLDMRADPQNLPAGLTKPWPWPGYAAFALQDWGSAFTERAEVYNFVRDHGITGFSTIAGDRHSFWAGLAAPSLPPQPFEPVGIAFVTGSISAPGLVEAYEHVLPKDHPLLALYLARAPNDTKPQPTVNMLARHGVRSCLEYARSGDIEKARAATNPDLAPHVRFVDMGGHGYVVVHASSTAFETEFVCIPRPLERSSDPNGGPLSYRVRTRSPLWAKGEAPKLDVRVTEGDARFST